MTNGGIGRPCRYAKQHRLHRKESTVRSLLGKHSNCSWLASLCMQRPTATGPLLDGKRESYTVRQHGTWSTVSTVTAHQRGMHTASGDNAGAATLLLQYQGSSSRNMGGSHRCACLRGVQPSQTQVDDPHPRCSHLHCVLAVVAPSPQVVIDVGGSHRQDDAVVQTGREMSRGVGVHPLIAS